MGQAAENLILLQPVGHGNLHGAIEGEFATVDTCKHLEGLLADILALQQFRTELGPGRLDLAGEVNLLSTGEQRNLAHLRQIHAHGIV